MDGRGRLGSLRRPGDGIIEFRMLGWTPVRRPSDLGPNPCPNLQVRKPCESRFLKMRLIIIENWTAIKGKFYLPVLALVPERNSFLVVSTLTLAAASTMEPPAVRWGIIGLGDVTAVKSGPPFWKCRGSELVAVFRRTPGAAHKWAKAYAPSGCAGYENIDDFLAHPGLDAIYIATPPGGHLETALKVAAAGKHCYVVTCEAVG